MFHNSLVPRPRYSLDIRSSEYLDVKTCLNPECSLSRWDVVDVNLAYENEQKVSLIIYSSESFWHLKKMIQNVWDLDPIFGEGGE